MPVSMPIQMSVTAILVAVKAFYNSIVERESVNIICTNTL